jgi:RNA polymerase sigma-70 factor (ECF subfamily)
MMTERTFESKLAGARAGEAWAWDELYRELAPRVLGYLRARRATEPEDLLGEIFLNVVRDLARFSGDESDFRGWVFTIAHHRLVDEARARTRRVQVAHQPAGEAGAAVAGGDVEAEALERLTGAEVAAVLTELTEDQRAVLLLRIFGDLSLQEVADALGKPIGAVKSLQHRAIGAVKRRMSGEPYPAEASERSQEETT